MNIHHHLLEAIWLRTLYYLVDPVNWL